MTTEDRLTHLESQVRNHDVAIDLLISIGERQQALLERMEERLEEQRKEIAEYRDETSEHRQEVADHRREVAEYRREAAQYRRLWIHLARKNGWLEDEDWPPPEPSG